ncbi:hypothetical protein FLP10_04660 [Agromyces intestinalis]|uniref:Uncharacterized protein n=1 Tax=Agromyces intestinalis TaxID=2592652 RepID=A0A5C1YGB6_9MICO|nr:hypothetical protein [Agromyces intestinalis]QEO13792.1 hypothetical protein FLP10_04660 [Agromyces intestinalis]
MLTTAGPSTESAAAALIRPVPRIVEVRKQDEPRHPAHSIGMTQLILFSQRRAEPGAFEHSDVPRRGGRLSSNGSASAAKTSQI